jgi:hypothetical protein
VNKPPAPTIELVEIPDTEAAVAFRFLGSPSVRVAGRDVEPSAAEQEDLTLACRIYRTERAPRRPARRGLNSRRAQPADVMSMDVRL